MTERLLLVQLPHFGRPPPPLYMRRLFRPPLLRCRLAFQEGEEAAWEDLEASYVPAANEGRLPLRIYAFVPLPTW